MVTSPAPGSVLTGTSVTFTWIANGSNASDYWLEVGSAANLNDIYDSGPLGTSLSTTVSGLPTDGSPVYVRFWYLVNGTWKFTAYQYTADPSGISGTPAVTSPAPSSTLTGTSVTFIWIANGSNASEYWLEIGSAANLHDIYDSGSLGTSLSTTVSGLPTDGSPVYARLWYRESGTWKLTVSQYTADPSGGSGTPAVTSPAPASTLTGTSVTFTWITNGSNASDYWLEVGSAANLHDIYDSGPLGSSLSTTVSGLPTDGSPVYVRFWYLVNGTWEFTVYQYTAAATSVDFYYVAFGDSITAETGGHDNIPGDDTSADGRNTGGGFEPILNDLLTNSTGFSHTVENEGVSGDESIDGVNRIAAVLAAHPNADYLLILLGTNDSFGPVPSGVGLSCTGLSPPSNDPGCPGTYKDNMQKIINAIVQAGKIPLMAKVPIRYGDCDLTQCWTFPDPYTNPANLLISQEYNVALDQLRASNGINGTLGNPFNPPGLYTYFAGTPLDTSGKSVEYDDIIHPGGLGYQSIANLWLQALTE